MKTLPTSGDVIVDGVCSVGLFELLFRASPYVKFRIRLGSSDPVAIENEPSRERCNEALREVVNDEITKERLNFTINVGKPVNAYEHFTELAKNGISDISFVAIRKGGKNIGQLLPMSIMPVYGKGLRSWNGYAEGVSARFNSLMAITYLIGIAYYSIHSYAKGEDDYAIFLPPIGIDVEEDYLMALRRVSYVASTSHGKEVIECLKEVPTRALALVIFSLLDLSIFSHLLIKPPIIAYFAISKGRAGEGCRKFEVLQTQSIVRFYYELAEWSYGFKRYISDLAKLTRDENVKNLAVEVLNNISMAIDYAKPSLMNLALHQSRALYKEKRDKLFIPSSDELAIAIVKLKEVASHPLRA